MPHEPTSLRPHAAGRARLAAWFAVADNLFVSNRIVAAECGVDESTVRNYRKRHKLPSLVACSGAIPDGFTPAGKRKRRRR